MLKAIFTGETFKRSVITILIISMMLPFVTAFVNENSALPELEPYRFDPELLPQLYNTFAEGNQPIDLSDFVMPHSDLDEPSEEELEELMIRGALGFRVAEKSEFKMILNSGLSYSELTEDDRSFIFNQLNISDAAESITEQLFEIMKRDGFSLSQSIELMMIVSTGLFDYAEAQQLLNHFPSTYERLIEIQLFERFAELFDIASEINTRRLVRIPFMTTNRENDLDVRVPANVSALLDANRVEAQYSFVEDAQMAVRSETDESESHSYVFEAFTSANAFSEARRMFVAGHCAAEIEIVFALGAAMLSEPQTLLQSRGVRNAASVRNTSADDLLNILFADVLNQPPLEFSEIGTPIPRIITPVPPIPSRLPEMIASFNAESVLRDMGMDALSSAVERGVSILNYGASSIAPMTIEHQIIVDNPFKLHFDNDTVALNTGAANYRVNVLSIPGRNGFGVHLDLVYNSFDADVRRMGGNNHLLMRRNLHGLGVGWKFDLPFIYEDELYIPGRGRFQFCWNMIQILDYTLYDMRLSVDMSFVSGQMRSLLRLRFHNGTSLFFNENHILGKVDRFGNTIRFEYADIFTFSHLPLLSRIVDSNGNVISFQYQASGASRTITITDHTGGVFTINMSRITGMTINATEFQLDSVVNQVGAVTTFLNYAAWFLYDAQTKTPRFRNYTLLLWMVIYPSGALFGFEYRHCYSNMGYRGSRQVYRVQWRVMASEYVSANFTRFEYVGDPTDFPWYVHRPYWFHTYTTTVIQNNGLETRYVFNYRHLIQSQRTTDSDDILLSTKTIIYNNDLLPIAIGLTEHRGELSRMLRQDFTYNRYGQITQSVSPVLQAQSHLRRPNHTYDSRFGLPLTTTFWPNGSTQVREQNVLSADGRNIIRTYIYENNIRQSRTDFIHDSFGNVIEIREFPDAMGTTFIRTLITYDRGTMPTSIRTLDVRDVTGALVGGNGIVERSFTYDAMWRVISETDPSGYVTRWQYDRMGRITRIDFPNGGFVTYAYNDQQNIVTHRTILGAVYTYRYDKLGNLRTITDPCGTVILQKTFDGRMRLREVRNAQGIDSSSRTTFHLFDIFDRVRLWDERDSQGVTTHLEINTYFDLANWGGDSRIETSIFGSGSVPVPYFVTYVQFDNFGRKIWEGIVGGSGVTYTYDLGGRVTQEFFHDNGVPRSINRFTHNIFGVTSIQNREENTSHMTYDSMGRLVSSSDFMGNVQRFTYDELGRLIRQEVPFERDGDVTHYAVSRYFYDRNGNMLRAESLINLPGEAQQWAGTENTFRHNMLISSQTGGVGGIRTEYTYDLAGNILAMRVGDAVTTYTYNNRGQLTQIRDALGQVESFTYDANGLLLTRTDRNGTLFRMTYDNMGRLIREEAFVNGVSQGFRAYTFTRTGALHSETNGTHTIIYSYDAQGRVVRVEESGGIVRTYSYNTVENVVTSRVAVNGYEYSYNRYVFDVEQRLIRVLGTDGWLSGYTYDANGNRTSKVLRNGVRTYYTFNLANMVTSLVNKRGDTVLSSFEYTYYLEGNTSRVVETMDGKTRTITYTYDLARRLIREQVEGCEEYVPQPVAIDTWDRLRTAINEAPAGGATTIYISGSFAAPSGAAGNAITIPSNRNITLVSNNATVRTLTQANSEQRHFIIPQGASLTLGNGIILSGGAANNTNDSGGVQVNAGGVLTMQNGSIIENCHRTIAGGAVQLQGSGTAAGTRATFNMTGGIIRNNSGTTAGGVNMAANSTFTMSGGTINGNTATSTTSRSGGGVRLTSATSTFTMSGGTISGNRQIGTQNHRGAGGVHIDNGTFTMSGGSITGNSSAFGRGSGGVHMMIGRFTMSGAARISGNTATGANSAGGVHLYGNNVQFTMNGGTIGGAAAADANSGNTGGVRITGGTFNMNGGTVSGNTGGGVRIQESSLIATFTMSGGTIENNTNVGVNGAGVHIANGNFTMTGGTIRNNQQNGGATINSGGAGVRVEFGTFTMNGASARIENNTANGTATSAGGGGIRHAGGAVNITAGTIVNNTSTHSGGGIKSNANRTNLNIGANAVISNNTPDDIWPAVVEVAPTHVAIEPEGLWYGVLRPCWWGCCSTGQLRATVHPLGTDQNVVWSSDSLNIVSVDQSGLVSFALCCCQTCCCNGFCRWCCNSSASITATAVNGVSDTFLVGIELWWRESDEPDLPSVDYRDDDSPYAYVDYYAEKLYKISQYHYYTLEVEYHVPDCCEDCVPMMFDMPVFYETDAVAPQITSTSEAIPAAQHNAMTNSATNSFTRTYTFDNRGNRVTMIVTGAENYTVTYSYDLNNRLLSSTRTGDGAETSTFTYDRNGNQLTATTGNRTETRTYNAFNQLVSVNIIETGTTAITNAAINVTAPVTGAAPNTTATGTGNFTISAVTWSPNVNVFAANTRYTATMTLTANAGHTFTGLTNATINGNVATITNNTGNTVTLSFQFPETGRTVITNAAINVTAPVTGAAPNTAATGTGNFTISAVTWSPNVNVFAANTRYTATVTLTANAGHTFTGLTTATINGNVATITNNTGNTVTLSFQFPATGAPPNDFNPTHVVIEAMWGWTGVLMPCWHGCCSSVQLTATVHPSGADQTVIWSSGTPDLVSVDQSGFVSLEICCCSCCCDGFCRWCCHTFIPITATAVNGVFDTFWVQIETWWREHDEPDDLPSENSEESDDVLSYPNLIEALAQVTAIHDTHSLTDVEEVEEIVLNTDNSDFNTNNNQTTVAASSNAPGTTTVFYTYRADGLRRSKTVNGVTTTHIWDGANIVLEQNANGGVINVFTRDARGNLIRSTQHGFYLFNKRGDVVQRVDAQGVVLHTYRYDAFGNYIGTTENSGNGSTGSVNTNPFRFASMYWDAHRGEYMTPNRMFNPRIGRWTQPDPYWGLHNMIFGDRPVTQNGRLVPNHHAIIQAGNLFVYCGNDPVNRIDPWGLAYFIFHCSDFLAQARWQARQLHREYNIIRIDYVGDFITRWNEMAAGTVYGVVIIAHGSTRAISFDLSDRFNAISVDGLNSRGEAIRSVSELNTIRSGIRIYVCNAGSLAEFRNSADGHNIASALSLRTTSADGVVAFDGNVAFGISGGFWGTARTMVTRNFVPRISNQQAGFYRNLEYHGVPHRSPLGPQRFVSGRHGLLNNWWWAPPPNGSHWI